MRLTHEELEKVKEKYGVSELYSFSKFDLYRTSQYVWMLKYLKKLKENNDNSAYAPLGNAVHDVLEKLYDCKLLYKQLVDEFDDIWNTNIEIVDLKFDRCDSVRNNNIKEKYYADINHFFKNYKVLPYKMKNEQFVAIKITDDIVFQGYIDAIYKDENDVYTIVDYKTSTKYTGKAINEHAAQLVLYSEALRQKGISPDKIRCCWNFLKYVNIDCEQVNGNIKTRIIERHEIGVKLESSVKTWLKKLGYKDKVLEYTDLLVRTNDISVLPKEVQDKYVINDCYVYVDDIWKLYEQLKEEIIEVVTEIREKTELYKIHEKNEDYEAAERLFWDNEESLKAQSYYYNNLCGYSVPTVKPYKEYLDKINANKNENLSSNNNDFEEDDFSWLDGI